MLNVYKATRIWFYDAKNDDGLTGVISDWNKEVIFKRGIKISQNPDRLARYLPLSVELENGGGDGIIKYAIFKGKTLKGWGRLIFNSENNEVLMRKNRNLVLGNMQVANWRFGPKQGVQVASNNNINSEVPGPAPAPVPEPATMLLLGMGLVGLAAYGRKRFKN
jgi:hypothetical protein